MKRLPHLAFAVLAAAGMSACGTVPRASPPSSPTAAGPIRPGDEVEGILITTGGDEEDIIYVSMSHCPYDESTQTESCELPVGSKVNVSLAFYDEDPQAGPGLDEIFAGMTYSMSIDGRPLDLDTFGSIDVPFLKATLRHWNVVVVGLQPGTIRVEESGTLDGEAFEYHCEVSFVDK